MSFIRVSLIWFIFYKCNGDNVDSVSSINSADLASNINSSTVLGRQAGYGLVRFDGEANHNTEKYGFVNFDGDSHRNPLTFEATGPSYTPLQNPTGALQNGVSLQDGSSQNNNAGQKRRRKRRRRKFRRSQLPVNRVPLPLPYTQAGPGASPYSRPQTPLSPLYAISGALSSIVENDTKRCVSRMLCEQAANGKLDFNSSIIKSVYSLMQYLPLLQQSVPYSSLPLFKVVYVLSHALNIGILKNATCLSEFPECPSDPEERILYLNNHNGGLFRFFGGHSQHKYTAEEFHNHLQYIGLHAHSYPHANSNLSLFELYRPNENDYQETQQLNSLGQYGQYGFQNSYPSTGYGVQKPNYQTFRPNANELQYGTKSGGQGFNKGFVNNKYGLANLHYRRFNNNKDGNKKNENENEIQRRIQNKPDFFGDDILGDKIVSWSFPKIDSPAMHFNSDSSKIRNGRQLKFPDNGIPPEQVNVKQPKRFSFPGAQSNRQYLQVFDNNDDFTTYEIHSTVDNLDYDVQGENSNRNIDDGVEIVYVVRGNGDPSKPEIIKLRPGEQIN